MMRSHAIVVAMLTIASVLAAAPIVNSCEGLHVLLEDELRSSRAWSPPPDDLHAVRDGRMIIEPAFNRSYLTTVYAHGQSLSDIDACVDVAIVRGGPQLVHTYGGMAFWVRTTDDFYELMIGPSGSFSVDRRTLNGRSTIVPFTTSSAVKSGLNQVNRLRVTIMGSRAILYINGVQVANIIGQPPPRGGYIGLTAQSGPNTRDVFEFTNFKVTD
jgi:hypothetical protein